MASLVQLWNEWEIQLLVLLSFALQVFLFFTGNLRRHTTNIVLRFSIWLVYLEADLIAIYALGFLSRHAGGAAGRNILWESHSLAFFWAPFLLIHLGGQDTNNAFSVDDNNLWLRHLLNLIVQVGLAIYVFLRSIISGHNLEFIIPVIFVFITGIIKYGERTWALMCGRLESLGSSTANTNKRQFPNQNYGEMTYDGTVDLALHSMPGVQDIFAGRTHIQMEKNNLVKFEIDFNKHCGQSFERCADEVQKRLEIELYMIYDDIYTKAVILRTRIGVIFRCFSQASMIIGFVLFVANNNKLRNDRTDVVITYTLFIGYFFLEACSLFMIMMSPWTWAWLKARECHRLANLSWLFFSCTVGLAKKKMWSNSIGQYNLVESLGIDKDQARSMSKLATVTIRKMLNVVGVEEHSWISKFLQMEHVKVDDKIMACVVQCVQQLSLERTRSRMIDQRWKSLNNIFLSRGLRYSFGFGYGIIILHLMTYVHLRRYTTPSNMDTIKVCQTISNYMLYLFVVHSSMLPVIGTAQDILADVSQCSEYIKERFRGKQVSVSDYIRRNKQENEGILEILKEAFDKEERLKESNETLETIKDMWIRLLVYAAGKSRPEMHARQLGRGGELLTFVWLLMAHAGLGDFGYHVDLIYTDESTTMEVDIWAFDLRGSSLESNSK